MGRSIVSISPSVGFASRSRTAHGPGRGFRASGAIRPRATPRSGASGSEEPEKSLQSPLSIVDAFMTNPVAFMAGAFVGLMELDVLSDDSAIARVLRQDRG